MHLSIVYLAVLATSWVKGGEAYKCDPNIIASMKKFNKEAPSHIMATNIELSPDYVAYTTQGFYANEEDICSVSGSWTKDGELTIKFIYKNQTALEVPFNGGPLKERNGITYDEVTMTLRYHVHMRGKVAAFYRCQENGKEGPPEAMVKVWEGYKEEDLEKTKQNMEMLVGCKLNVKYDTV